jgi:hypothetical protein
MKANPLIKPFWKAVLSKKQFCHLNHVYNAHIIDSDLQNAMPNQSLYGKLYAKQKQGLQFSISEFFPQNQRLYCKSIPVMMFLI